MIENWNNQLLKSRGINAIAAAPKAVRAVGDAKRAELYDGTVVYRSEALFVSRYGLVKCAPQSLHFVYELPEHMKGWTYMCTCGSIAGVVGIREYSQLASPESTGWVLVCLRLLATKQNTGIPTHADGSTE